MQTLDQLRSEIADHLDRGDLNGRIDTFIRLAESRHERDLRIREMLSTDSFDIDDRTQDLPDDMLEAISLRIVADRPYLLTQLTIDELAAVRTGTNRRPRYYAITQQIEFETTPDTEYPAELLYYARVPRLTDESPDNVLLDRYPDAYLYAALAASAPYLMNDERIQVWDAMYQNAVAGINRLNRRDRRAGPQIARVAGWTP